MDTACLAETPGTTPDTLEVLHLCLGISWNPTEKNTFWLSCSVGCHGDPQEDEDDDDKYYTQVRNYMGSYRWIIPLKKDIRHCNKIIFQYYFKGAIANQINI